MAQSGPRWASAQERARERLRSGFQRSDVGTSNHERFVGKHDTVEDQLKMETVGLVHLQDFQRKREELLEEKQREAARTSELKQKKKEQKRRKDRATSKLSFDPEEGDEEPAEPVTVKKARRTEPETTPLHTRPSVKDPKADTSFLPDRDREAEERRVREEVRQEWLQKQDKLKQEEIEITYSYWDGSGHRNCVRVSDKGGQSRINLCSAAKGTRLRDFSNFVGKISPSSATCQSTASCMSRCVLTPVCTSLTHLGGPYNPAPVYLLRLSPEQGAGQVWPIVQV